LGYTGGEIYHTGGGKNKKRGASVERPGGLSEIRRSFKNGTSGKSARRPLTVGDNTEPGGTKLFQCPGTIYANGKLVTHGTVSRVTGSCFCGAGIVEGLFTSLPVKG
jgi:hypothetical protein